MNLKFTLSSLVMVLLLNSSLFSQGANTMTVNSPASIAGEYTVFVANYGDQSGNAITGDLVFVNDGDTSDSNGDGEAGTENDGCQSFVSDVNGQVAVVDRGDCFFGEKSDNGEAAGATVVLICNNDIANPDTGIVPGAGPNGEGNSTTILTVGTSYNNCEIIKMALANGAVNATFGYVEPPCAVPDYGPEVIWGNERGQGDFEDGPNEWTTENEDADDEGWEWVADFSFFGRINTSATACNGFMHLNSWDLGVIDGTGTCDPCNGGIVSPVIDLTGHTIEGLYVEFDQVYFTFFSRTFLLASKDGGVTYPDTFPINQLTPTNATDINTFRVALPGYEGAESLRLKFYKNQGGTGNIGYYYWAIDDVRVINEGSADMQANYNFFASAATYRTALSQTAPMPFLIDVFNAGNQNAVAPSVDVEVFGPSGAMVFSASNDYPDVPSWTSFENRVFPDTYTPDEIGFYNGRYIAKADSDVNGSNDTIPFFFEVTDNTISPLPPEDAFVNPPVFRSMTAGSTWQDISSAAYTLNYAAAHIFYIPNGADHTLSNVRFGVEDDPNRNGTVNVWLYAWLRTDDNTSGNFSINADNTLLVGAKVGGGQIINPAFGSQRIIDVEMAAANLATGEALLDGNGDPVPIELRDDQLYVMVLATNSNNAQQISLLGFDADSQFTVERNWNVSATNLALDSLGSNRLAGADMVATPNGNFNEIDNVSFTGGTWGINELYIEYTVQPLDGLGTEDLNETQEITVYPNPASSRLFVELSLEESSAVTIEIVDLSGKMIQNYSYDNIVKDKLQLDVSDLTTGLYHVNIRTEAGFTSKRIVITK